MHTQTIACIGAGRMGRGIAHSVAYAGHPVRLLDAKARSAEDFRKLEAEATNEVAASLAIVASLGGFEKDNIPALMDRVSIWPLEQAAEALAGADIVFEGVPEVREAKADAFALFDAHADRNAVLASTTSTMLSTDLAELTERRAHFLNAHWLNPAFLVPLVEVSPSDETSLDVQKRLMDFLESIGKVPVICKASPGYIVPRIQALAMNEAARLVEEGVASAEDVDRAVKYGFGLRFAVLGLLEFIDWGGGDILYYASRYMSGAFNDPRFEAPEIVKRNMEEGRIGLKTGQGFFDYASMDVDAYRQERLAAFLKSLQNAGLARPPVL